MNSFKNCGIITIQDQGLKSRIFLLYWFRLTGLFALYMEHYCEKMNSLGCGHRKKMYGNNLLKKIAYQRLYFPPPSFVHMKDIFYVRTRRILYGTDKKRSAGQTNTAFSYISINLINGMILHDF